MKAKSPPTSENVPTFEPNGIYTTDEVAAILRRNVKAIRLICKRGQLKAKFFAGGWLISGFAICDFLEINSAIITQTQTQTQTQTERK